MNTVSISFVITITVSIGPITVQQPLPQPEQIPVAKPVTLGDLRDQWSNR